MDYSILSRSYSTFSKLKKSASLIRNEFLDYFKNDLDHTFVRSSPVIPLNDYTVAFVNAGMNQFKGIFLDYYDPPTLKVTNSQKCIRIGGKHNDLNAVGNDTYHHTFFEMLGNWSFGSYFKKEACSYAWNLLTKRYGIPKEFLYVTYFGGDNKLGLEPDLECQDIWLTIGVPKHKVISFGMQENFWEMGPTGPCGPCTEIHVDQSKQSINQSVKMNNLTELWNIVFIQHQRLPNGTIVPLSKHHVDTGMGFERLVALLQGKSSNYDTDLFQPLIRAIQKHTNAPQYKGTFSNPNDELDYGYRILADHSRMITVALADGVIPEESNKLRKIIRKTIDISDHVFKTKGILFELSYVVAESLGDAYPELQNNLRKVQKIISFEEELYKRLQHSSGKQWKKIVEKRPSLKAITEWTAPGLANGYKYLQHVIKDQKVTKELPGNIAFILYDTYGLSVETINELAEIESLYFDESALEKELDNLRNRSKIGLIKNSDVAIWKCTEILKDQNVAKTDDSFKYKYIFDGNTYQFPQIESKIIAVVVDDNIVINKGGTNTVKDVRSVVYNTVGKHSEELDRVEMGIILDKTVCYSLEGGQTSDRGLITMGNFNFTLSNVRKVNGYVIHYAAFQKSDLIKWLEELSSAATCMVSIDPDIRFGLMQHHTAAHLINACVKQIMPAVYVRSSYILTHHLKLQFNSFGEKPSLQQLTDMEKLINDIIKASTPVTTKVLNTWELLAEDFVTLTPGEVYPYNNIRVVEVDHPDLKSKEACCGTHVLTTKTLEQFCFLDYFSKGATNFSLKATVGSFANSAKLAGENLHHKMENLEKRLKLGEITYETYKLISKEIEKDIKDDKRMQIPLLVKERILTMLKALKENTTEIQMKKKKRIESNSVSNSY